MHQPASLHLSQSISRTPSQTITTNPTRKSKQCEAFLQQLAERGDINLASPGFVEDICAHFERLPTRYALDVNIDSLDVLSHKRLLEEARSDPATVSFAVRGVAVLAPHHHADDSSPPGASAHLAFPAEVRCSLAACVHAI